MFRLALSALRFRTAAFLAVFVAVLLGSSLMSAAGGLLETGVRLKAAPQRLAAAPILVTGRPAYHPPNGSGSVAYPERHGVDPALVEKLARTPGVAKAVPDVSFSAVVAPGKYTLTGHGWPSAELTPYQLTSGTAPAAGEVVLDQRLAGTSKPGDKVNVIVSGGPREFVLAGLASPRHDVDAPSAFFAAADTPDRVDAIGVFPAPGTSVSQLVRRLDLPEGVSALTGDDRGAAEFAGIATSLPMIILSGVFGGMVAVVMALVVSATISLFVRQRRRELALLRAGGATPGQVHKMVVTEMMLVSMLALAGGLLLGRTTGTWIFGMLTGNGIVPPELRFDQGPLPFAGAAVLTLVILRLTVGLAAGRAARIKPIQALAEAAVPPVVMGGARLIRALLTDRVTGWLERRGGTSGVLAAINLRVRAVQFAAILVPITLATAIALGNIYWQTTQQKAAVDAYTDNLSGNAVITSDAGGIPDGLFDQVRSAPGVTVASELVRSKGWIEEPYDTTHTSDPWPLLGLNGPVYRGKVHAGSLEQLTGDTVALPPGAAKKLKVGIGDEIGVRLGDDALVKVKIVALVDGTSGYESILLKTSQPKAIDLDQHLPDRHCDARLADPVRAGLGPARLDRARPAAGPAGHRHHRPPGDARRADGRGQLPGRLITRRS